MVDNTLHTEMESDETGATQFQGTVVVVYRRHIERMTEDLSPVCPSGIHVMVVVVVLATDMVGHGRSMVMIYGTTLVFTVKILKHHRLYGPLLFGMELRS